MDYQKLLDANAERGILPADLCRATLYVNPEQVLPDVVIAPWWHPKTLQPQQMIPLSDHERANVKAWQVEIRDQTVTYLQTGIGAPSVMDTVLALGTTACRTILFIGSVGGLDPAFGIGDLIVPQYSVCGDGASRYIAGDDLGTDVFGARVTPHDGALMLLQAVGGGVCRREKVPLYPGRTFSTDSIFAQLAHIDRILGLGCNSIEMETAAAFRAGKMTGKPLAALLCVSDLPLSNKSLYRGRSEEEQARRYRVRGEVMPQILCDFFQAMEGYRG
ncbi:MAG TPA: hypothetical protein PKD55_12245 [Bellilinea sp.]|nr:hypothetical protein [Bellilinea sp.]